MLNGKADPPDEPIIITGGSPLRLRIQNGGKWIAKGGGHKHSNSNGIASRVSFDYVDDDRWLDFALHGNWKLSIPYGTSTVTIAPENGQAGLEITGASLDAAGDVLHTPDGSFGPITLNGGSPLPAPTGRLRIAIEFK